MPIHDWTRVPAGLFHHFHLSWSIRIADALNAGILPQGVAALVEQRAGRREPHVLAIESQAGRGRVAPEGEGSVATTDSPAAQIIRRCSKEIYSGRANRIVVRHHLGRILAVIELMSPGNKASRAALQDFVEKMLDLLREGIHVLIVDLFPPSPRDPHGIHKAIWDEIEEEDFQFPAEKDRVIVAYETGAQRVAYIEPLAVGDALPEMPLFLTNHLYVQVPLELTSRATWDALPQQLRTVCRNP